MQRALLDLRHRNCFLFDLDGTLIDSNSCHERAYLSAFASEGSDLAKSFSYERYKGLRTKDVLMDLGIKDETLLNRLTEAKQRFYRESVDSGDVELIEGARVVLEDLNQRKKRIFLVTGASQRSTKNVLVRLGISDFFEDAITADDVERSKPWPDCYLKCIERARISRQEAIAIEDAIAGVESAKAAGLEVLILNNPELAEMPEYMGTFLELHEAIAASDNK